MQLESTILETGENNMVCLKSFRITAIGLLAVGFQKYGDREQLQNNPIKHLYDIYVKINADKQEDSTIDDTARGILKC